MIKFPKYQLSRQQLGFIAEILVILLWSAWVGRVFLDFNTTRWPDFSDFALNLPGYFPLSLIGRCGMCFAWNGTVNGGAPTFGELLTAFAHPLVMLSIGLFGYINGLKVMVVLGLFLAGLVQWSWARVLKLGWQARLWGAILAVTGGHVVARMAGGLIEVSFSIVSCSLIVPVAVQLAKTGSRRTAIVLGLVTGLAAYSGQGYLQIGTLFGLAPAMLLLIFDQRWRLKPIWKEFLFSGLLAVLIAALLWLPIIHFLPNYGKDGTDPQFLETQSAGLQALNLVIDDPSYYVTEIMNKTPWPAWNVNYIGWIPLLLILFTLRFAPVSANRMLIFFATAILLVYLTSSGVIFRWVNSLTGLTTLGNVRSPVFIQSLAVPLLIALSAWGVDLLSGRMRNLQVRIAIGKRFKLKPDLRWLILIWPLLFAIKSAYGFGQNYFHLETLPSDYLTNYGEIFRETAKSEARWIEASAGDWVFMAHLREQGGKITNTYHPWHWNYRDLPKPSTLYTYDPAVDVPGYEKQIGSQYIIQYPENHYAYVQTADKVIPCQATALGGNIDVTCKTETPGTLIVAENSWSGWYVNIDGKSTTLLNNVWLSADAPVGAHRFEFRYRPWDVPLAMFLVLTGLVLALIAWIRSGKREVLAEPASKTEHNAKMDRREAA